MTVIQVIDAARALANEPLDSTRSFPDNTSSFWTDSQLLVYFNMVQQDVSLEIIQSFEDYFATQTNLSITSGCANYTLPTRFIKMTRVEDIRQSPPLEIYPTTLNEKPNRGPYFVNQSGSYWLGGYYLEGNQIVFDDTPTFTDASAIRAHFIKGIGDLSASTEVSDIPPEHHRILVWGILRYMYLQQQGDTTRADLEYEKMMSKLKSQCEDRQIQRPRHVKTGPRGR